MSLRPRASYALPYVVLALGFLFFVSRVVLGRIILEGDLALVAPSYVAAGAFALLYAQGKIEKTLCVLAVPATTFLILTGVWLYFDFPGPYAIPVEGILLYGSISLFYVLGHAARAKKWSYVAASALAYPVCIFTVNPPSSIQSWGVLALIFGVVFTLGAGIPLAVVAYVLSDVDS